MTEEKKQQNPFGFADLSETTKLHLIYNDLGILIEKISIVEAKLDQIAAKIGLVQQQPAPVQQQQQQQPVQSQVQEQVNKEEADSIIDIM